MSLTASTHLVIPTLIGRGMTEGSARAALARAKMNGFDVAQAGNQLIPISYAHGKYTVGTVR